MTADPEQSVKPLGKIFVCVTNRGKERSGGYTLCPLKTDKQKEYLYQEVGRIEKARSSERRLIKSG